ncbi:hypothetical protein U8527_10350 [Kordia algicida OT-1]|uniref:Uncharacterized protein n=1 Tax=Kordia algicida OT-1 TaxID=391587 RepID=A9DW39_9FLAO|nr:hypothetical protein [Kordia algicida]EDP96506.1 hypothetical protein KAOT1_03817 [Kordia algicida OT-1]
MKKKKLTMLIGKSITNKKLLFSIVGGDDDDDPVDKDKTRPPTVDDDITND